MPTYHDFELRYKDDDGKIITRIIQAKTYGEAWWLYPGCLTITPV